MFLIVYVVLVCSAFYVLLVHVVLHLYFIGDSKCSFGALSVYLSYCKFDVPSPSRCRNIIVHVCICRFS